MDAVEIAAMVLGVLGALLSAGAAGWLVFGFRDLDRYAEVESRYNSDRAIGVERLVQEQGKVAGVALGGAAAQLLAVVLSVLA